MCGINGIVLSKEKSYIHSDLIKIEKLFTELMISSEIRGRGASGIICSEEQYEGYTKQPVIHKLRAPLSASDFVKTKAFSNIIHKITDNTKFLIGHTRNSTASATSNNRNNHPHQYGDIMVVHNGHITNHEKLWKEIGKKPKTDCDSEIICAVIDHVKEANPGADFIQALEKALDKLEGFWAVAIVDINQPDRVFVAQDSNYQVSLGYSEELGLTCFASTYTILNEAARKAGVKLNEFRFINTWDIYSLCHSTVDNKNGKGYSVQRVAPKNKTKEVSKEHAKLLNISNGSPYNLTN